MGLGGTRYVYNMGQESKAILNDNYRSIGFAKSMMQQLDAMHGTDSVQAQNAIVSFKKTLQQEANNITEIGEKEVVDQLRADFELYQKGNPTPELADSMRAKIYRISEMNMQALEKKNMEAQKWSDSAIIYVSLLFAFGILISFSLIFNLSSITE
ncbi:hypothetical protein D3C72_711100 [compost metagenome]